MLVANDNRQQIDATFSPTHGVRKTRPVRRLHSGEVAWPHSM